MLKSLEGRDCLLLTMNECKEELDRLCAQVLHLRGANHLYHAGHSLEGVHKPHPTMKGPHFVIPAGGPGWMSVPWREGKPGEVVWRPSLQELSRMSMVGKGQEWNSCLWWAFERG